MYINNVNNISNVTTVDAYKQVKASTTQETGSVNASMDVVEISPTAKRQAEIATFLKGKPYTTFEYERALLYAPEQADKFIDELMKQYDTYQAEPFTEGYKDCDGYSVSPRTTLKSMDEFCLNNNLKTSDDIVAQYKKEALMEKARNILDSFDMSYETYLANYEKYGVPVVGPSNTGRVMDYTLSGTESLIQIDNPYNIIYENVYDERIGTVVNSYREGIREVMYENSIASRGETQETRDNFTKLNAQRMEVDKLMQTNQREHIIATTPADILLYVSDSEPDPRENYLLNPDKWIITDQMREDAEERRANLENFIAGLSEDEKKILKDNKFFNAPAFASLNIKGIEYFTIEDDAVFRKEATWLLANTERRIQQIMIANGEIEDPYAHINVWTSAGSKPAIIDDNINVPANLEKQEDSIPVMDKKYLEYFINQLVTDKKIALEDKELAYKKLQQLYQEFTINNNFTYGKDSKIFDMLKEWYKDKA